MSDNPNKLKAILLDQADTETQREFAKMLAEQCAEQDLRKQGHICWFFVPSPKECEKFSKFNQPPNYDRCPKCGKGRVVIEIYRGNVGDSWHAVCRWGVEGCDFKEYVSDDL